MLAWTPNRDANIAVTTVDYHYYTSLRKKTYYQHHDGADEARFAALRFAARHPKALHVDLEHQPERQCFIIRITEVLNANLPVLYVVPPKDHKEAPMPQGGRT